MADPADSNAGGGPPGGATSSGGPTGAGEPTSTGGPSAAPGTRQAMPPRWKWAPGTVAVSVLCGGLWIATKLHPALVERGAMVPIEVWNGQWWRLVTALFLHGSFIHVGFNVALWWNLAALIEVRYGTVRLLGLALLTGVAGNAAEMMFSGIHYPGAIGLSGAVFGIFFFGFLALRPLGGPFGLLFSKTFAVVLIGWAVLCVALTRLHILPVANFAHAVGALSGLCIGAIVAFKGWRKVALSVAGAALAVGLTLGAWRPPWSPGWQLWTGSEALAHHHTKAALAHLAPLAKRFPNEVAVQWRYAVALAEDGRGIEARRIYQGFTEKQKAQVPKPVRLIFEAAGGQ